MAGKLVRARRSIIHPRLDRALIALAALCVLTMPVEYRGGAEAPHAHAIFQFWGSENADAFDHHGHNHETSRRVVAGEPTFMPMAAVPGGRLVATEGSARPAPATRERSDVPTLSEMSAAAERTSGVAVAVSAVVALLVLTLLRRLPIALERLPTGVRFAPDPPPPRRRRAAASCLIFTR